VLKIAPPPRFSPVLSVFVPSRTKFFPLILTPPREDGMLIVTAPGVELVTNTLLDVEDDPGKTAKGLAEE
jgi:hypothetical protein